MSIITDEKIIDELLSRSVKEILPTRESLKEKLLSGDRLRIYIGTDATGTSLHLGHATNYMVLEKLRSMGHEVIFLIGDFTSRIGDPTDKSATRIPLSRDQVIENTKTWLNQIRPIIDFENTENPVRILYNHDWLSKMNFEDVIGLASHFTVQQMLERDMFEKRINENKPIHIHEFFYPLMQGYDSVVMDVDVELCGNDQKFNALCGRTLQRKINNKEKFVFITTLLENPKTGEKMMSKSMGTGVFLDFNADQMVGGIMAQPDENMRQLFIDCTFLTLDEITQILNTSDQKNQKIRLALEITTIYHGSTMAQRAIENWEQTFSNRGIPNDIQTFSIQKDELLIDTLINTGIISSRSEFRRLMHEHAIKFMEGIYVEVIMDEKSETKLGVYKIGKKRFIKII